MVLVILLFFCYTINSGGNMKKILYIFLIILLGIFSYIFFTYQQLKYYEEILNEVEVIEFNINSYSIFGTHLNMEGCINKKLESPELILKNKEEVIVLESTFYEEENNTCFYTSEYNDGGIYLDGLNKGNYILLVKDNESTYTLNNNTEYKDLEYYTITKNNINNKINIKFKEYEGKHYINFVIKESKLPDDVYDISIDPGHGGKDPGAIGKLNGIEYYESNLTLSTSLLIKEELEEMGLKVHITRDEDAYLSSYGTVGRAVLPNNNHTKYSFSIHFNSSYGTPTSGGVEVYTPNDVDYTLATMLADNLSKVVGYSKNSSFRIKNGVYFKYFKQKDIDESRQSLLEEEMLPYDITLGAPYMYMIREVGGIHTYAYIDGRNEVYGLNKHYNSNHTAEPYLIELAYINYSEDLAKVLNNPKEFSSAVSNAIKEYLNIS